MLAAQRRAAILTRVRTDGAVRVADLVADLGVSDMTIRRDLEALAERRLVSKVHGGATVPHAGSTDEPGFAAKSVRQRAEKVAIARAAAKLVEPGSAVALSAGTTTAALAALLVEVAGLTVVTNSVPVAEILHTKVLHTDVPHADAPHTQVPHTDVPHTDVPHTDVPHTTGGPDQTVVLTGGVRTRSDALVGPVAVAAIRSLHLDTLFLGVHGMSERAGYTTPNLLEAETDRALVAAAGRLVVLADHTKWGTVGMCTIAPLSAADVVVTDDGLPEPARAVLADAVAELRVVAP